MPEMFTTEEFEKIVKVHREDLERCCAAAEVALKLKNKEKAWDLMMEIIYTVKYSAALATLVGSAGEHIKPTTAAVVLSVLEKYEKHSDRMRLMALEFIKELADANASNN